MKREKNMKKYKVTFIYTDRYDGTDHVIEEIRFEDEFFSRNRFQPVITNLFFWASQGIKYQNIRAIVTCDDFVTFIVNCMTTVDGSTIWADLSIDNDGEARDYRRMCIAC